MAVVGKRYTNLLDVTAWLFVAVCVVFSATICFQTSLDPDLSVHVELAKRMLAGEKLYKDMFEVNLPMVAYSVMPAVLLSLAVDYNVMHVLAAYNIVLACFCFGLCHRVLLHYSRYNEDVTYRFAVKIALAVALFLLPFLLAKNAFGEKPHIFFMMFLPYVFLYFADVGRVSLGLRLSVGVVAALGVCMKPYYALVLFAFWGWTCLTKRGFQWVFRVEHIAVVAVGLLYIADFLIFYPNYMSDVLPQAMLGYGAYSRLTESASLYSRVSVFMVPAVLMYLFSAKRPFETLLMVLMVASVVQVFLQHGRWHYVLMPAIGFSLLVAIIMIHEGVMYFVDNIVKVDGAVLSAQHGVPFIIGIGFVFILLCAVPVAAKSIYYRQILAESLGSGVEDDMFFMAPNMFPQFPTVSYHNVGAFNTLYSGLSLLDGLHAARQEGADIDEIVKMESTVRSRIVDDFLRLKPQKVMVRYARSEDGVGSPKFYIDFFLKDPRFVSVWASYSVVNKTVHSVIFSRVK
jgi:hypothetical protein